eukprot:TRINITY_DN1045_c0_g1_i2.p1 TRINITY_DN1045_c0_g1~~TRINITY_DN1045_c0_g1_i2.p1  ORF type:complete len:365 (+),score=97.03 TRINITY_DN1045_c0_g1_i2:760-1854(+)
MLREYIGYIIPPIPTKKLTGNTDPEFIQERKAELQMFLNDVLKHPLLKNYELFLKFISLPGKEWEERAKLIGKIVIPRDPSQYETVEGQAKILYSDRTNSYCERLQASTKDLKEIYHELRSTNKTIAAIFDKLSTSMTRAGLLYQKISAIYSGLDSNVYAELFMDMYDGHSRLGEIYKSLREEFLSQFGDFYSFYGNEISSVEELLAKRKNAGEHMDNQGKKLLKRKEIKFEQKNTGTWELEASALANIGVLITDKNLAFQEMLPKESCELRKMKMFYGYFSNKIVEEFGRLLSKNELQFKTQFEKTSAIFIERELHIKQVWTDTLAKLKQVALPSAHENCHVCGCLNSLSRSRYYSLADSYLH